MADPKQRPSMDRVGYSVTEFASAIGVAPITVQRLISRGELPSVKVGKRRVITTQPDQFLRDQARKESA